MDDVQRAAAQAVQAHNQLLQNMTSEFTQDHPQASIVPFDFYGFLIDLLDNATATGINTQTPCTQQDKTGVCKNPQDFVWFDSIHPSYWVHAEAGLQVAAVLAPLVTT